MSYTSVADAINTQPEAELERNLVQLKNETEIAH